MKKRDLSCLTFSKGTQFFLFFILLTIQFYTINTAWCQACNSSKDCDDGNPCTYDICNNGTCTYNETLLNGVGCPDDGNECSSDYCTNGECIHDLTKLNGLGCPDDGNECSSDYCTNGECIHDLTMLNGLGCSDDGNECTADYCSNGDCTHNGAFREGISCEDDGNDCTNDICENGNCTHIDFCDDKNPCTLDFCFYDADRLACLHTQIPECEPGPGCSSDMDCSQPDDSCKYSACNPDTRSCKIFDRICCPPGCKPPCVSVDLCTVSWCDGCFCLDWSIPNCKLESPPIPDPIYIEPGGSPPPAVIVPITSPPTILILAQTDGGILSSFYFFAENQTGLSFELPSDGLQIWSFDLDGSFKPPVIVDLPYLEEDLLPDIDENRLAIFHVTNEGWVLLPSVVDTNNNRVSAKSLSLGVFALGIVSKGDFDRDGDVDGSDLEMLIKASDMNLLPDFALNFGKMVGP